MCVVRESERSLAIRFAVAAPIKVSSTLSPECGYMKHHDPKLGILFSSLQCAFTFKSSPKEPMMRQNSFMPGRRFVSDSFTIPAG
jgi:hypothetical protein